ncbi:MAG: hypothetical protein WD940_01190 [Patescibacteria group bacterium]
MKRRLLNAATALVIAGIWILAPRFYNYEPPPQTFGWAEAPDLKAFPVVDLLVDSENSHIFIALEIPERAATPLLIADVLETYRWSQRYFRPLLCGEAELPYLCKIGLTEIYLVSRVPASGSGLRCAVGETYVMEVSFGLNQLEIERLLNGTLPETLQEFFGFHQEVGERTGDTGGYLKPYDPPQFFCGFPR